MLDGLGKVSDGLGKVSVGLGKASDGLGKVLDGLGKVLDGHSKVKAEAEIPSERASNTLRKVFPRLESF